MLIHKVLLNLCPKVEILQYTHFIKDFNPANCVRQGDNLLVAEVEHVMQSVIIFYLAENLKIIKVKFSSQFYTILSKGQLDVVSDK